MKLREYATNHTLLRGAQDAVLIARDELEHAGLGMFNPDNVAVLFSEKPRMDAWVQWCTTIGLQHYRAEEHDTVYEIGAEDHYHVNFEFLRYRGGTWADRPFRVEAMHINAGSSPIHDASTQMYDETTLAAPVQVSFKCMDVEQMSHVHDVLRMYSPWREVGHFVAGYGFYTYFRHPQLKFYLKSRVNLRD